MSRIFTRLLFAQLHLHHLLVFASSDASLRSRRRASGMGGALYGLHAFDFDSNERFLCGGAALFMHKNSDYFVRVLLAPLQVQSHLLCNIWFLIPLRRLWNPAPL
ncbi:hypothetical protein EDB89DRAFT_2000444 [Lactarius sanguifluus]|nr:hypothetical protein EDB89DRAFT_2000444 [Lactarius sanguifluus]